MGLAARIIPTITNTEWVVAMYWNDIHYKLVENQWRICKASGTYGN